MAPLRPLQRQPVGRALPAAADRNDPPERIEAVVALTVLYEPVLLSLRRLAQTEESGRRFGE